MRALAKVQVPTRATQREPANPTQDLGLLPELDERRRIVSADDHVRLEEKAPSTC